MVGTEGDRMRDITGKADKSRVSPRRKVKGMKCFECGEDAEQTHHVVPLSQGGTKTVPLCKRCHTLAHRNGMGQLGHIGIARSTWQEEARARLDAKGIK